MNPRRGLTVIFVKMSASANQIVVFMEHINWYRYCNDSGSGYSGPFGELIVPAESEVSKAPPVGDATESKDSGEMNETSVWVYFAAGAVSGWGRTRNCDVRTIGFAVLCLTPNSSIT